MTAEMRFPELTLLPFRLSGAEFDPEEPSPPGPSREEFRRRVGLKVEEVTVEEEPPSSTRLSRAKRVQTDWSHAHNSGVVTVSKVDFIPAYDTDMEVHCLSSLPSLFFLTPLTLRALISGNPGEP